MIVRMLSVTSPNCLQDKKFADFFIALCEEKKIVEYYLADNSGSFLLLDEDGRQHVRVVGAGDLELPGVVERHVPGLAGIDVVPLLLPIRRDVVQPGH